MMEEKDKEDLVLESVETAYGDTGEPVSLGRVQRTGSLLEHIMETPTGVFDHSGTTRRYLSRLAEQGRLVQIKSESQGDYRWLPGGESPEEPDFYLT